MARKRQGPWRNLLFVGGIVALAAVLAVALQFIDRTPTFIMPEAFDPTFRMAERESPDNAYSLVHEASRALPERTAELADILEPPARDFCEDVRPVNTMLGNFLGVAIDCPPNNLTDYLLQCGGTATAIHEALQKPYYLRPEPIHSLYRFAGWREKMPVNRVAVSAIGYGAVLTHTPGTARQGLDVLLDCVRFSRFVGLDQDGYMWAAAIEDTSLQVLCLAARKPQCAEHLAWLQEELEKLGPPNADRLGLLHRYWRGMDDAMMYKHSSMRRPGQYLYSIGVLRDLRYRAPYWVRHRAVLEHMMMEPPSKMNHLLHSVPEVKKDLETESSGVWWHTTLAVLAAHQDLYFQRAVLQVALQRFHNDHAAYPQTLEELVPAYMAQLPTDPMNGLPFRYVKEDARVRLYSLGENETDNNAEPDDLLLLLFE